MLNNTSPLKFLTSFSCSLLLTACGGGGSGSNGGETPQPANNPPTISGSPSGTARPGQDYVFTPSAADTDGDTLTFQVDNLPLWMAFDPATGALTGMPILSDLGVFADIQISVSDGEDETLLAAFQVDVIPPLLNENSFSPQGVMTPIDTGNPDTTGYVNDGILEVDFGNRMQRFENSVLELEFDSEGNLLDISGETDVPVNLAENVTLANTTRARVGLLTGAEINSDPNFGITLKDEFEYFAFYISTSTELTIGDPNDPSITESLTLDLPLSGEIVFISDPYDPFFYRYASVPFVGEFGRGDSFNGFIPFIPQEDFDELDSFEGNILEKGSFGIGFKVFDFFNIEGSRVIRLPNVIDDIDWLNPLDSAIEFKAGINGEASFSFAILSVGIFDFSLATASTTLDVGFDRQHAAMQTTIAPDVSWQPDWFPILPTTEIVGNWSIDGSGEFSGLLSGSYDSQIPPAQLSGLMEVSNTGAMFSAEIPDPEFPLSLSLVFENNTTTALIDTPTVDINPLINSAVDQGFDRAVAEVEQALAEAEAAFGNYQIAFSLDGLRSQLPNIADQVIGILNGIPQTAYDETYDAVLAGFRNTCRTYASVTFCGDDFVDEVARAQSAARTARNKANDEIAPYLARLNTLKDRASNVEDGPAFRSALKVILLEAIDNRLFSFSYTFSQTVIIDFVVTSYSVTVSRTYSNTFTIINSANTALLQTAADNVDDIDPAYTFYLDTQAIFDSLPTEEAIAQARQEVENNVVQLPTFSGAGYTVTGSVLTPFVILDGDEVPIGDGVNPLDPASLLGAIGDAIANQLLQ
jgi:hypothetical protein